MGLGCVSLFIGMNLNIFYQFFSFSVFFNMIFDNCFLMKYYSLILIMGDILLCTVRIIAVNPLNSNVFSCNDTFMEKKGHLLDEKGRQPLQVIKIMINFTASFHTPFINIDL